jgi:inner membrane protein
VATAFTHAFVAVAAGRICYRRMPPRFWLLAIACSAGPDLDVGLHHYGVEYLDLWGHRGMTHSLLFALVVAAIVVAWPLRKIYAPFSARWWGLLTFFFALTASHGFIDAFTDGGHGIAFFSPFDTTRYFMPWTPLVVPHFGLARLFTSYGAQVMLSEILWVWMPVGAIAGAVIVVQRWSPPPEAREAPPGGQAG